MKIVHHDLDINPIPEGRQPLFVNETALAERYSGAVTEMQAETDNIRIYIPLDLNKKIILERLDRIICHYGEANEANEFDFSSEVNSLIPQIEIYDQIWYVRHMPDEGRHSSEARELVRGFELQITRQSAILIINSV